MIAVHYVLFGLSPLNEFYHFRCQAPQKTDTSVPSMLQGLLGIEGIWV